MNKRLTFLIGILCAAGSIHAQLRFEELEIEYQASLPDEKSEAVFRFTNEGKEAVEITRVASSCGCTVPQLEKNLYQPGESGEIRAVFTFGSRIGTQRKRITVQSSGAGTQTHELFMVTHIPEWVQVQPRILRWQMDQEATAQAMQVEIPNPDEVVVFPPEGSAYFDIRLREKHPGHLIYSITPKSVTERVTEFISFRATAGNGDALRTREFGIHCLIR